MSGAHDSVPAVVLGGTGYVSGELLRLLAGHPRLRVAAVASTSQAGEKVCAAFPHLKGLGLEALGFETAEAIAERFEKGRPVAVFAATPHGATAALLDRVLGAAERVGADARAVDLSADFRFPEDASRFEAIYGKAHGAPRRLGQFVCAVPEHVRGRPPRHAAQPGCFTTAATLAAYPFYARGLVQGPAFVAAITGSSGSGRTPGPGTHHPERHGALHAYSVLAHRHEAEMRRQLGAATNGVEPEVEFVPHSGPFVRGIHATLRLTLVEPLEAAALVEGVNAYYADSPFVEATLEPPKLNEVVGTNRCRLGLATRGRTLVVTSVIDNLVKGAAGGAVQWMNRLFGWRDDEGLRVPGLAWF